MNLIPKDEDFFLMSMTRNEFSNLYRTRLLLSICLVLLGGLLFAFVGIVIPLSLVATALLVAPLLVALQMKQVIVQGAKRRRYDMELATAVFLDLVNVLLAGGTGVETAILAAASAGDGWGFLQIRLCIARSQSGRLSYWDGLRELGRSFGVDSLVDVSNSVQLAGEHGARIRQSLAAKAASLRQKNLARIEYEAEQRTEKMGLPIVLLFLGFILLIGYPALIGTIGAL